MSEKEKRCANRQRSATQLTMSTNLHCTHTSLAQHIYLLCCMWCHRISCGRQAQCLPMVILPCCGVSLNTGRQCSSPCLLVASLVSDVSTDSKHALMSAFGQYQESNAIDSDRSSFQLQFRSRSLARAPCHQKHSDNKHAVCVFKSGKSIGGDGQLLSGMNNSLHLVLDVVTNLLTVAGESFLPPEALGQQSCGVSPHMSEQTLVMTISCCLAWTPLCICVRRRYPTMLTVVRKSC